MYLTSAFWRMYVFICMFMLFTHFINLFKHENSARKKKWWSYYRKISRALWTDVDVSWNELLPRMLIFMQTILESRTMRKKSNLMYYEGKEIKFLSYQRVNSLKNWLQVGQVWVSAVCFAIFRMLRWMLFSFSDYQFISDTWFGIHSQI